MQKFHNPESSWNRVKEWYSDSQETEGDFFHKEVIFPNLLKILKVQKTDSILDLACGEGVFSRVIPLISAYLGVDIGPGLIDIAKQKNKYEFASFKVNDVSKSFTVRSEGFSICTLILALQNIQNASGVFKNAYTMLKEKGRFAIVLNHPYYRIPKATSWEIDEKKHIQYRRVDRYMSSHKIAIDMTPGANRNKELTASFHEPLSFYIKKLVEAGFVVTRLEEWVSPKRSDGRFARMENTAREEFPVFMCIIAEKI